MHSVGDAVTSIMDINAQETMNALSNAISQCLLTNVWWWLFRLRLRNQQIQYKIPYSKVYCCVLHNFSILWYLQTEQQNASSFYICNIWHITVGYVHAQNCLWLKWECFAFNSCFLIRQCITGERGGEAPLPALHLSDLYVQDLHCLCV